MHERRRVFEKSQELMEDGDLRCSGFLRHRFAIRINNTISSTFRRMQLMIEKQNRTRPRSTRMPLGGFAGNAIRMLKEMTTP